MLRYRRFSKLNGVTHVVSDVAEGLTLVQFSSDAAIAKQRQDVSHVFGMCL